MKFYCFFEIGEEPEKIKKTHQLIPYNRISDLFDDFYGIRISPATIKKAENECFNNLEHFEEAVMKQLLASHSVHCNETVIHDGWGSYNKYECEHALCNAHLKRELTGIEENFEQQWAKEINGLLR